MCKAIDDTLLSSSEMAAKWKGYLAKIGKREGSQKTFLNKIKWFILSLIKTASSDISKIENELSLLSTADSLGDYHKGLISDKGIFYGCSYYLNGCKLMLTNGSIIKIKGLKSKKGKSFDVSLKLEDLIIKFDFNK